MQNHNDEFESVYVNPQENLADNKYKLQEKIQEIIGFIEKEKKDIEETVPCGGALPQSHFMYIIGTVKRKMTEINMSLRSKVVDSTKKTEKDKEIEQLKKRIEELKQEKEEIMQAKVEKLVKKKYNID